MLLPNGSNLLFLPLLLVQYQSVLAAVGFEPGEFASRKKSTSVVESDGQVLGYTTTTISVAAAVATPTGTRAANPAASSAIARLKANDVSGISVGSPNNALPDPCGPPSQAPGPANSTSTCQKSVSLADVTSQQYYGVQCLNDKSGEVLEQATCSDAMIVTCEQMSGTWGDRYQMTNEWIWTVEDGNCTFGYWLPEGGAPPPSYDRCVNQISPLINEACQGPEYNVGTVNLRTLPAADASGRTSNGSAVDADYPSYIMVAQQSAWGANGED